jgi:hypothetical protein
MLRQNRSFRLGLMLRQNRSFRLAGDVQTGTCIYFLNTGLKLGVLLQREEPRLETAEEYIWIQAGGRKRKMEKTEGGGGE